MKNFFEKIKEKRQAIFYMTLVFASFAFLVATLIPPKYRSDVELLIIQNNADAFSASKGVSYLSDVFIEVAHTETFFSDVLSSPFDISKDFSSDPKKRKKQWEEEVKIKKINETGIVVVSVFDVSRSQAEKIAAAIGWNFLENGNKYYGETKNIAVKIIDGPITSSSPAYPNVFLAAFLGAFAGLFSSLILIFFYEPFDIFSSKKRENSKEMIETQIKRQLEERKVKKELNYDEEYSFTGNRQADEARKGETYPKDAEKVLPFDDFEKQRESTGVILKDAKKKHGIKPADGKVGSFIKGGFLNKLYGRSVFSDRKLAEKEEEFLQKDRDHQEKRDEFADGFENSDDVRKITTRNDAAYDESELRMWKPGGAKAPAPENLPIFLEESDAEERKIDESAKKDSSDKDADTKSDLPNDIFMPESTAEVAREDLEMSSELIQKKEKDLKEDNKKEVKTGSAENAGEMDIDFEKEPSDDEVKERLNKLLKGEL